MATRYPRKGFYEYHRQFSLMSPFHLKFHNILVDWSVRNITLFCKIFANDKVPTCMYLTIVDRNLSNFFVMTHKTEKFQIEKEVDLYSRKWQYHAGKEICNNFNSERRCQLSRYKTAHLCSDCNRNCLVSRKSSHRTWILMIARVNQGTKRWLRHM